MKVFPTKDSHDEDSYSIKLAITIKFITQGKKIIPMRHFKN